MIRTLEGFCTLLGRILLAAIFLMSGLRKIGSFGATAGFMDSEGMVATPFFLVMAILFEVLGSISVMVGFKARAGALALIVFLIPATLIFHDFWTFEGQQAQMQMQNFIKNSAILGGLFIVAARGAGPWSLDDPRRSFA